MKQKMVDILQNIMSALIDSPALTLIIIDSFAILVIMLVIALGLMKSPKWTRILQVFAGFLILVNLVLALPMFIDMIFK